MDIVEKSNTSLRCIENNDPTLTYLSIVNQGHTTGHSSHVCFWVLNEVDLSRLGNAIGKNTHLKFIEFYNSLEWTASRLDTTAFFEGLSRNTTIKDLWLRGGFGNEIINFVENHNLIDISITCSDLRGSTALVKAISRCSNLNQLDIVNCDIDDAGLKDIASGIRGLSCLQKLLLWNSSSTDDYTGRIDGIEGAESIVSMLQDPSCNLTELTLACCGFNHESMQMIVNSLMGNTKLKLLSLYGNSIGTSSFESIVKLFQTPSCNLIKLDVGNSGINNELATKIVTSLIGNTKLEQLVLSHNQIGRSGCESIATLLQDRNSNISKMNLSSCEVDDDCATILSQALVANNKLTCLDLIGNIRITEGGWNAFSILLSRSCSNHTLCSLGKDYLGEVPTNLSSLLKLNLAVDMEPLFELDSEDDERKPKALPFVIDWFDRHGREFQNEEIVNNIKARKLSGIFQFARAMPLQFVPSPSGMLRLHEEARDQLIKAKEELEDKIKVKDTIIASYSSIDLLSKKRKHGV